MRLFARWDWLIAYILIACPMLLIRHTLAEKTRDRKPVADKEKSSGWRSRGFMPEKILF